MSKEFVPSNFKDTKISFEKNIWDMNFYLEKTILHHYKKKFNVSVCNWKKYGEQLSKLLNVKKIGTVEKYSMEKYMFDIINILSHNFEM